MDLCLNPERKQWRELQLRCQSRQDDIRHIVAGILDEVKQGGDRALREISLRIDGSAPDDFQVSDAAFADAAAKVAPELKVALENAKRNIEMFHAAQLPRKVAVDVQHGVRCIQKAVPIQRVGLYIPGGKAPLFSTVLMLAVPAKIAGCCEVVLCTPPRKDGSMCPEILFTAQLCGIDRVYALGGAQAIAAMAYGTESVPKVDKIFGPGNRFVTTAKQMVSTDTVAIDMPAGPSEVMVMADASANPAYVAADLLSQCEHGEDSQAILLCNDAEFAEKVKAEVENQKEQLPRKPIIEESLKNSRIIVFTGEESREQMIDFANQYGSEHLIISMQRPWDIADQITAAGSIFIGNYSPESAGDYASGTNHTLPTSGWARSHSGVNIDSFMRKITYQQLSGPGLRGLSETIITMALAEGLHAHANAVAIRMKGGSK